MDKTKRKLEIYHGQILALMKSYEGKSFLGKLVRNRQDIRGAYLRKAEDLLLKMIEIDENSSYVEDARKKLYGNY